MYYLIRWKGSHEAIAIMDGYLLLTAEEIEKALAPFKGLPPGYITTGTNELRWRLINIVEQHVKAGQVNWYWESISEAVYETYRDLHGFEVIKCTT